MDPVFASAASPFSTMMGAGSAGVINFIPGARETATTTFRDLYNTVAPDLADHHAGVLRTNLMAAGWW